MEMDRLEAIFRMQAELQAVYQELRPTQYAGSMVDQTLLATRAAIHELAELEDELNWKPWKNAVDLDANREHRLEETVDVLHFVVLACLTQGFTEDEVYEAYLRKNHENRMRQIAHPAYRATPC